MISLAGITLVFTACAMNSMEDSQSAVGPSNIPGLVDEPPLTTDIWPHGDIQEHDTLDVAKGDRGMSNKTLKEDDTYIVPRVSPSGMIWPSRRPTRPGLNTQ